jgi:hypothetical protein
MYAILISWCVVVPEWAQPERVFAKETLQHSWFDAASGHLLRTIFANDGVTLSSGQMRRFGIPGE